MKRTLITASYILLAFYTANALDTLSVGDCVNRNLIDVKIKSNGGHMGDCAAIHMASKTHNTIVVWFEPGRTLNSVDPNAQDLIIVNEEFIVMQPQQNTTLNVFSFCNQANNRSPHTNENFTLGQMANNNMTQLCAMMNNSDYPQHQMQTAIWVMGSGEPITIMETVGDTGYLAVLEYVSEMTNQPLPWYTVHYQIRNDQIFQNRPVKVTADYSFELDTSATVTVIIYNKFKSALKPIMVDKQLPKGEYETEIEWDVTSLPKDTYFLKQFINGQEKEVLAVDL